MFLRRRRADGRQGYAQHRVKQDAGFDKESVLKEIRITAAGTAAGTSAPPPSACTMRPTMLLPAHSGRSCSGEAAEEAPAVPAREPLFQEGTGDKKP